MSLHEPSAAPPSFAIRSTEDVIALVPLVLGFHPSESLVVLTFGAPTGSFHARVDLPHSPDDVEDVAELLARAVRSNGARTVFVVAWSADREASLVAVDAVVPALRLAGADVLDVIRVDRQRWWPLAPGALHDAAGTAYDVSAHPFAASYVLAGEVVRTDRQAVADSLVGELADPACCAAREELARAVGEIRAQRRDPRLEAAWLRDWLATRAARPTDVPSLPVPPQDAARVIALVQDDDQREVACLDLTREVARRLCDLWSELVRRAPDDLVAGPAAVLALAAWLAGDGALAWCAIDRAREHEPDSVLMRGVARALQDALPPASWRSPDPRRSPVLREGPVA